MILAVASLNDSRFQQLTVHTSLQSGQVFLANYKLRSEYECAQKCINSNIDCAGFRYNRICGRCDLLSCDNLAKLQSGKNYARLYMVWPVHCEQLFNDTQLARGK